MQEPKIKLCVRNLFNKKHQITVSEDFSDFWVEQFLPIEFVTLGNNEKPEEVIQTRPVFSHSEIFFSGQTYPYSRSTGDLINIAGNSEQERMRANILNKKNFPLLKCFGELETTKIIYDLSFGQGKDGLGLCRAGFSVHGYERNIFIAVLFLICFSRLDIAQQDVFSNFSYVFGDFSQDVSLFSDSNKEGNSLMGSFYYDPMYQLAKRKSLPRGVIQLFENLVGQKDEDQEEKIQLILKNLKGRLVVKNPLKKQSVVSPTFQVKSKLVRYDVYVRN